MFILYFSSPHFCFVAVLCLLSPLRCRLVVGPGIGCRSWLVESGSRRGRHARKLIDDNWREKRSYCDRYDGAQVGSKGLPEVKFWMSACDVCGGASPPLTV